MNKMKGWVGEACPEISVCILAGGLLAGCGAAPNVKQDTVPVQFEVIEEATSTSSGFHDRDRIVIRDQSRLSAFWSILEQESVSKTDPPASSFDKRIVIAAAMGGRTTGGYTIEIEDAYTEDGRLYVVVHEKSPGADCAVTQALTQPVTAAEIMSDLEEVLFVERHTTVPCDY